MIVGLDHAFLTMAAGGEEEARRFYSGLLGLEEMPRPEGLRESPGLWFRAGEEELHLGVDDAHSGLRRAHPGFRVESVTALAELARRVKRAGHAVQWDERIEGRRRFYVRDPFGNRLELLVDL